MRRELKAEFAKVSIDIWMDTSVDFEYGTDWVSKTEQEIRSCHVFILLMSGYSKKSKWVQHEMKFVLENSVWKDLREWTKNQTLQTNAQNAVLPSPLRLGSILKNANTVKAWYS